MSLGVSTIPGASEGLFARKDLEINTTVAFYHGTRSAQNQQISSALRISLSRARPEEYDPDTWETNNYKIFDPADMPDGTIDIPVWAQSSQAYTASLAHKTNHSFLPNCQFVVYDHPKFGLIPSVSTIADIPAGAEITVAGGEVLHWTVLWCEVAYGYEWSEAPEWYKLAWSKSE